MQNGYPSRLVEIIGNQAQTFQKKYFTVTGNLIVNK